MFHSDVSLSRTQSEIVTGEVSSIALPSRHLASVPNANNNHNEKSPQASQNPNCNVTTHLQQVAECHAEVFEVEDSSDHTSDSVSCSPDGVGSKRPGCFKNYGLMGLVILLIFVTVATLSALVYFGKYAEVYVAWCMPYFRIHGITNQFSFYAIIGASHWSSQPEISHVHCNQKFYIPAHPLRVLQVLFRYLYYARIITKACYVLCCTVFRRWTRIQNVMKSLCRNFK